jgi:hypothetical protein
VVCDAFASETVAFADLVLPDTTYLERHDVMRMLDRPISEFDGPVDSVRVPVLVARDVNAVGSRVPATCDRSASALRAAIDSLLHTFPRSAVVLQRGEQVFLVGPDAPRRVAQALQIGANGFDAALEIADPRVEPMKQDGALQFGRLERGLIDGAHEDARAAVAEQFNAELAVPAGQALRWCDLGQIRIYLQGGHGFDFS